MARLAAGEMSIQKIFSNDYRFEIPPYQRPYAWTTEEAGQLFDDLIEWVEREKGTAVDEMNPYFLGSIVLIKGEGAQSEVIDGQQRLTTLTLLLAAARHRYPNLSKHITPALKEEGNPLFGTQDRFRLLPRHRDREFYQNRILGDSGPGLQLSVSDLLRSQ